VLGGSLKIGICVCTVSFFLFGSIFTAPSGGFWFYFGLILYPAGGPAGSCALAAIGHAAAPPSRATNSRRCMPGTLQPQPPGQSTSRSACCRVGCKFLGWPCTVLTRSPGRNRVDAPPPAA